MVGRKTGAGVGMCDEPSCLAWAAQERRKMSLVVAITW